MPAPWWDPDRHADRSTRLHARAALARRIREWFHAQGYVEVEPGLLCASPGGEVHTQAFETVGGYLHTSPEFAMKKLIAAGEEKLFFLGKCFRAGEMGALHAPEFTMLEWYERGEDYRKLWRQCAEVLALAAGPEPWRWRDRVCDPQAAPDALRVADAFTAFAGVDLAAPLTPAVAARAAVAVAPDDVASDLFAKILTERIEPKLGIGRPTILCEYPASESVLSRRCAHDPRFAERFELYVCGIELANGSAELTDPALQRETLREAMAEKARRYGRAWPLDEAFLTALAHLPPTIGCAMGFDRLAMLAVGAQRLEEVLWTPPQ